MIHPQFLIQFKDTAPYDIKKILVPIPLRDTGNVEIRLEYKPPYVRHPRHGLYEIHFNMVVVKTNRALWIQLHYLKNSIYNSQEEEALLKLCEFVQRLYKNVTFIDLLRVKKQEYKDYTSLIRDLPKIFEFDPKQIQKISSFGSFQPSDIENFIFNLYNIS